MTINQPPLQPTPVGAFRFNTDSSKLEYYDGNQWVNITSTSPEEQTGGTRGLITGGNWPGDQSNEILYINVNTTGNAIDFGDFAGDNYATGACSSRTRGIFGGGKYPANFSNMINYVTIASTGNVTDFGGDLSVGRVFLSALSDSTRGIFTGGQITPGADGSDVIDYITMASTGNAVDFGNLTAAIKYYPMTCASPTRGIIGSGSPSYVGTLDYITTSTLGNAADFGDTTAGHSGGQGCSNATRGLFGGGYVPGATVVNIIDYITISTLGNALDFGDLTLNRRGIAACSSSTRAAWAGGCNPTDSNVIDYVQISTVGNAVDFGDCIGDNSGAQRNRGALSNGHGGLG